jgi:alpha-beta hydrolase superfamily lysophospholipase
VGTVPVALAAADGLRLDAAVDLPPGDASVGTVVQVHDLAASMDRGDLGAPTAQRLAGKGLCVVRFSFRGHGNSGGAQRGVTVAGELLDLAAAVEFAERELPAPLSVAAAGFGTVAVALSLPYLAERLRALVLWSPVFDLRHTFVAPVLPRGVAEFGPHARERLRRDGVLPVGESFEIGRVLFEEFHLYRPLDAFMAGDVPGLVLHGDRDRFASYEIARAAAAAKVRCAFHTVHGADHGFADPAHHGEATRVTADWLSCRHATR